MSNTYPEPYRSRPKDTVIDPSTCYNRECVSYVAWKIKEATGKWPKRTGDMNAKNWIHRLPENGYKKVAKPVSGGKYAGIYPVGTYGHALWWESGTTASEYNFNVVGGYDTRSIPMTSYQWFEIKSPIKKATKAEIDALYKQYLGRKADAGGLKTYSKYTVAQVKAYLLASKERKSYVAKLAKAEAAKIAKAKADAIAKAKAEAKAKQDAIDAAKKADAEAAAKAAEALKNMPDMVAENNQLLNKLVELVTEILNKIMGVFK